MAADRWDEQVGSVADEATRLLESLRRAAQEAPPEAGSASTPPGPEPDDGAPDAAPPPHDPFCQWCPLCRSAAVVRSLSPQTLDRLAELAGLAATVLADLAASRAPDPPGEPTPNGPDTRPRRAPASRPVPVLDLEDAVEDTRA